MTHTHETRAAKDFRNLIAGLMDDSPPNLPDALRLASTQDGPRAARTIRQAVQPGKACPSVDLGKLDAPPNYNPIVWATWANARLLHLSDKIDRNSTHLLISKGIDKEESEQTISELTLARLLDDPRRHSQNRTGWQIVNYSSWKWRGMLKDRARSKANHGISTYSLDDTLTGKDGQPMEENHLQDQSLALLDYRLDRVDLIGAFDELPADRAMVARLNLIAGYKLTEIAERHGWAIGTTRSHQYRAKKALRAALVDYAPPNRKACRPYFLGRGFDRAKPEKWAREPDGQNIGHMIALPDLATDEPAEYPVDRLDLIGWTCPQVDRALRFVGPSQIVPPTERRTLPEPNLPGFDPSADQILACIIATRKPSVYRPADAILAQATTKQIDASVPASHPQPASQCSVPASHPQPTPAMIAHSWTLEENRRRRMDALIAERKAKYNAT